mgnify:FL=1|tara:strand:+ start:9495 stop:12698 length:3204 start_codon:yes stop_codon:yes gene_type:complete
MAEDKKSFLQGKMNKDIDARLLPNGEYRTAQNIQVSTSESKDVGTIQNIKGNTLINLPIKQSYENLKTIGSFFDETTNRIFYFITNYTCENSNLSGLVGSVDGPTLAASANSSQNPLFCAIAVYDPAIGIKILCEGLFLNLSTTHELTGINVLNDMLFFTDNFNQPRRINISRAYSDSSFYNSEQRVSVAKFAPFYPIRLLDSSNSSTMTNSSTVDSDFLRNQFVRFSYRFRYIDGEYSVMAPFTQAAFLADIYKEELDQGSTVVSGGLTTEDVKMIVFTAEVRGMVNAVNKIVFKIQMPLASSNVFNEYDIEEVQILCKIDNDLPIRVVDVISVENSGVTADGIINYTYDSIEPFKTLPQNQTSRVFDNVPLKAKSQEIIGSRIVYGNYFEKRDLSASKINFEANFSTKNAADSNDSDNLYEEYKYHSVKQRRKYQIGIVLSDIFGRQSPVILPIPTSDKTTSQRASVLVPSKDRKIFNTRFWSNYLDGITEIEDARGWGDVLRVRFEDVIGNAYSETNLYGWYSYRIVVQQQEQEYYNVYTNGILTSGFSAFFNLQGDNVNKVPKDSSEQGLLNAQGVLSGSQERVYPKIVNYNTVTPSSTADDIEAVYAPTHGSVLSSGDIMSIVSIGTREEQGLGTSIDMGLGAAGSLIAKIDARDLGLDSAQLAATTGDIKIGGLAVFETEPFKSNLDIFYETSTAGLLSDLNTSIENASSGISKIAIKPLTNGIGEFAREGLFESTLKDSSVFVIQAVNSLNIVESGAVIELLDISSKAPSGIGWSSVYDPLNNDNSDFITAISPGLLGLLIKTNKLFYFDQEGLEFKISVKANFDGVELIQDIIAYSDSSNNITTGLINLKNEKPTISLEDGITIDNFNSGQVIGKFTGNHGDAGLTDTNTLKFIKVEESGDVNGFNDNFLININTGEITLNSGNNLSGNLETEFELKAKSIEPLANGTELPSDIITITFRIQEETTSLFLFNVGVSNFTNPNDVLGDEMKSKKGFHNGSSANALPILGQFVFSDSEGNFPINTEGSWKGMLLADSSSDASVLSCFKSDVSGKITEVQNL